jgi:hypothetical protein
MQKIRSMGSLLDKKPARRHCVFTKEKLDKVGARLECKPHKSLRCLAQEATISKSLNAHLIYILFKQYRVCACTGTAFSALLITKVN